MISEDCSDSAGIVACDGVIRPSLSPCPISPERNQLRHPPSIRELWTGLLGRGGGEESLV